jgi:hypothetical protein
MSVSLDPLLAFAFDNHIGVDAAHHAPDWIPLAIPSQRLVFMNLSWPRKNEIPLQFAHEFSHVLAGGTDKATYTRTPTDPEEAAATRGAIDILMECYVPSDTPQSMFNIADFVNEFMIPMGYEENVWRAAKRLLPAE